MWTRSGESLDRSRRRGGEAGRCKVRSGSRAARSSQRTRFPSFPSFIHHHFSTSTASAQEGCVSKSVLSFQTGDRLDSPISTLAFGGSVGSSSTSNLPHSLFRPSTPFPSSLFQLCDDYSFLEVKPISGRPPETSHNDGIQLNGIFIVASYAGPQAGGPCSQNR